MTRVAPRWRICAPVLGALLIGACTVTTAPTPPDQTRRTVERFRETRLVEWDLTEPRTAQQLGVGKGRDSAIFDRDGDAFWTARLTLPGPVTFSAERVIAVGVLVSELPGGVLSSVDVQAVVEGPAELNEVLQRDIEQLGLEATEVSRLLRGLQTTGGGSTSVVLDGRGFGYLRPSVEVRVPEDGGRIALNYSFAWDASAAPGSAPPVG